MAILSVQYQPFLLHKILVDFFFTGIAFNLKIKENCHLDSVCSSYPTIGDTWVRLWTVFGNSDSKGKEIWYSSKTMRKQFALDYRY